MSEVIIYVRGERIQDERTAGMFQAVNDNHHRKARQEQAHMEGQARIRELERLEQQRMAEIWKLAWMAFSWVAGCTVLVILAHVGAVAGWVMQVGTTALSLVLGYTGGQLVR